MTSAIVPAAVTIGGWCYLVAAMVRKRGRNESASFDAVGIIFGWGAVSVLAWGVWWLLHLADMAP